MGPIKQLLAFALALALALETSFTLVAPSPVSASTPEPSPTVGLHWVRGKGSEGCADGANLARKVEEKLGSTRFTAPASASFVVEGSVSHSDAGYRAELRTFDADGSLLGSREVVSKRASCAELSEMVAVVLAIMLDPNGELQNRSVSAPAQSDPEGEASCEALDPAPLPLPCPVCTQPKVAEPAHKIRKDLSAFVRIAHGHVPDLGLGGGVALDLGFARAGGIRLEGIAFREQSFALNGEPKAGSRVRLLYASVGYCPLGGKHGPVQGTICAALAAGALQSRGFGFDVQRDSTSLLLDTSLTLRGSLRVLGALRIYAGAGVGTPLIRTQLEATRDDGTRQRLLEQKAFSLALDLGLGASF